MTIVSGQLRIYMIDIVSPGELPNTLTQQDILDERSEGVQYKKSYLVRTTPYRSL